MSAVIRTCNGEELSSITFTPYIVHRTLSRLKSSTSKGPCGIPNVLSGSTGRFFPGSSLLYTWTNAIHIMVAGEQSSRSSLTCGVPQQGSVLGPILFVIYCADVIAIAKRYMVWVCIHMLTTVSCTSMQTHHQQVIKCDDW